ncbi:MAG: hypothetical protein CBE00_10195 [Planctomycetaceae bacterium TMED240]|nr:hypothetical protein [Rhodopirellula sp.]OUX05485.1 MAG: hypothetical protein CBE00_10195 [Planctomycetaceae bacterium TMED240]
MVSPLLHVTKSPIDYFFPLTEKWTDVGESFTPQAGYISMTQRATLGIWLRTILRRVRIIGPRTRTVVCGV